MAMYIHFLNVGHGDCTIVQFPSGRIMMIDINNSKSLPESDVEALAADKGLSTFEFKRKRDIDGRYRSWEDYYQSMLVDPTKYFKDNFPDSSIFRYVQTHPDMDHMSGLYRLFWQEGIALENFWDVNHEKSQNKENFDNSPYSYMDWLAYVLLRNGGRPDTSSEASKGHKALNLVRGDIGNYWSEDGIEVLSPTEDLIVQCNESESYNNCSYVLKLEHAGRTVILPGDAENSAWNSILKELGEKAISCDILKASHHGRESGYHKDATDAMSPEVVICSVGKKPATDASDEYQKHGATVLSTRYCGTITATIWDDGDIWIKNSKGERIFSS